MPVEIEIKVKVEDFEPVRSQLRTLGATRIGEVLETNTFFDTPDRRLLAGDRGLWLRTNRDTESGKATHVVTYKGPRQPGAAKAREEREVEVADPDACAAIFEAVGYEAELTFEKRRETWKLDDCKVELDELPLLGKYAEVEGPSETEVETARRQLHLGDLPHISDSYIAMLIKHVTQSGLATRVIRFS
jgi:adenylate cyclase class 2